MATLRKHGPRMNARPEQKEIVRQARRPQDLLISRVTSISELFSVQPAEAQAPGVTRISASRNVETEKPRAGLPASGSDTIPVTPDPSDCPARRV